MAFGLTSTVLYKWLKFSRQVLLFALQKHPLACVQSPTEEEIVKYSDAIAVKYPSLAPHKVWGAIDGLKLPLQQSTNWLVQNRFYNRWTKECFINSVFVFVPDGRIRMCVLNCPGTWHDSTMADYGIYDKLEEIYIQCGGNIVVDSAFKINSKEHK